MALRFRTSAGDEYTRTTNLPATTALTVMTVIKVNTFKGLGYQWAMQQDSANFMSLNWGTVPQNMSAFVRVASTSVSASVQGRIRLNTWLVAVFQREAATGLIRAGLGDLYSTDLIRYAQLTTAPTGNFTPSTMYIGDYPTFAGNELDSDVANVRIWTSILTASQLERERKAVATGIRLAVESSNLHADYVFDDNPTADHGPNGYNLTAGLAPHCLSPSVNRKRKTVRYKAVAATGRIFRIAGIGGGLAGPTSGLTSFGR